MSTKEYRKAIRTVACCTPNLYGKLPEDLIDHEIVLMVSKDFGVSPVEVALEVVQEFNKQCRKLGLSA